MQKHPSKSPDCTFLLSIFNCQRNNHVIQFQICYRHCQCSCRFVRRERLTVAHAADDMSVKCSGVNSCKGTSDCKTAKNECKGMNSCKGQGWNMKASAKECTSAGGKVVK